MYSYGSKKNKKLTSGESELLAPLEGGRKCPDNSAAKERKRRKSGARLEQDSELSEDGAEEDQVVDTEGEASSMANKKIISSLGG